MGDTFRSTFRREIGKRFSKASRTYRRWALPQNEAAKLLVEFLGNELKGETVLDAGAGVGLLTEKLLPTAAKLYVCDISLDSLKENPVASRRAFVCNMENLPLKSGAVGWTVSNFALHWTDWRKSLREFFRVSQKGFAFSVPVEGSLEGLNFPFPPLGEILDFVEPDRWVVKDLTIPFEGREFLLFFKYTGTGFNPNKTLSAFDILKNPHKVRFRGFKVLFAVKFLK